MRLTLILLITLMPIDAATGAPSSTHLPAAIRVSLDRRYPGWSFPNVSQEVKQFFASWPLMKGEFPHLIKGDFDGDGKTDYAVLIVHGQVFNSSGVAFDREEKLIVFLRRGRRYQSRRLASEGFSPDVYLARERRGQKGYSYNTNRNFTYKNDAISSCYFEKGAITYIYRKGRFRQVITSD